MKKREAEKKEIYAKYAARKVAFIFIPLASLVILAIAVTPMGTASLGVGEVFRVILSKLPFFDGEGGSSFSANIIIWYIRLPRIAMAIVCGMGFALAGAVMQGILRNPLASPFTLGISSGACFGGFLAMALGASVGVRVCSAFFVGLCALLLIYMISRRRGMTQETVILCGICLMYLFLVMSFTLAPVGMGAMLLLTMGNLVSSSWESVLVALCFFLVSIPLLMKYSWDLNAMAFGDETASSVGVNVKRVRVICMILATMIVSSIVCFTGVIGFVCLISPFIARMMMGNDHRFIFPCSALIGALLLLGTDTLARAIISPIQIPVGVLTTIIGVPFLLYLALSLKKEAMV